MQFRTEAPFLLLELAVALGSPRLAFEVRQVATEFVGPLGESLEIFNGVLDAILGLSPTLAILRYARRFLEVGPEFLGLGHHQLGNHALFDDRVAAGSDSGSQEDIDHVAASATRAVQVVGGLGVPGEFPTNGDFRIGSEPALGEFAARAAVAIVEDQFDGRQGGGLADLRPDEDDVGERFAAQLPRRTLSENPAHGVDDVGFAAAVWTNYGATVAREGDGRGVNERLEPGELDFLKAHSSNDSPLSRTCQSVTKSLHIASKKTVVVHEALTDKTDGEVRADGAGLERWGELARFGALCLRAAGKVGGFDYVVKLVWHVILIVLGKHFVGIEEAVLGELTPHHDAFAFLEQVRQQPDVADIELVATVVGDRKGNAETL